MRQSLDLSQLPQKKSLLTGYGFTSLWCHLCETLQWLVSRRWTSKLQKTLNRGFRIAITEYLWCCPALLCVSMSLMSCKANFSTQYQPCYNASIRRSKIGKRSNLLTVGLFQNFHNILFCPSKILHKHYFQFFSDLKSPQENLKTNAKFWRDNKEYYGIFEKGQLLVTSSQQKKLMVSMLLHMRQRILHALICSSFL